MEIGPMIVLAIAVIAVAYLISHASKAGWRKTLEEFAARHGLDVVHGGWGSADQVVGEIGGLAVTVDSYVVRQGKSSVTYGRVSVATDLPGDVTINSEGLGASLSKLFRGEDVALGDDAFDGRVNLRGDEVELVSRLNAPTRAAIEHLLATDSGRVDGGQAIASRRGYYKSADEIDEALEPLLELARLLRDPRPAPARLAALATADRVAGVRARALSLLAEHFPRSREAAAAARQALADPSGDVRLAAFELVPDDPGVRSALAASVADDRLDDRVRLGAARRLADIMPEAPVLEAHRAWFVAALDGYEPDAVVAAEVLGASAGIDAVEALLAHTRGVFKDGRLKDAARRAIDAIQARASGSAGALSLADAALAGGLSVAWADADSMSAVEADDEALQ